MRRIGPPRRASCFVRTAHQGARGSKPCHSRPEPQSAVQPMSRPSMRYVFHHLSCFDRRLPNARGPNTRNARVPSACRSCDNRGRRCVRAKSKKQTIGTRPGVFGPRSARTLLHAVAATDWNARVRWNGSSPHLLRGATQKCADGPIQKCADRPNALAPCAVLPSSGNRWRLSMPQSMSSSHLFVAAS
jgi:hypothetical protein